MKTILRSVFAALLVAGISANVLGTSASAAGRRIVLSSDRTGHSEIFVMDEDGTNSQQITNLNATSHLASWIPNSSKILFRSNYGGSDFDLFTINADGTGLTNLTNSAADESGGVSSPDGTRIAYLQDAGGGTYSLRVVNLSTLADTQIQSGFTGFWWLSNNKLVMYTQDAGIFQLYTINADGTGKTALTSDPGQSYFASSSPDGQRIAYYYNDGTNPPELRTINADGTGKTTVTNNISDDNSLAGMPLWSPDGSQILFNYTDSADNLPLMRINANGTGLTTITTVSEGGVWGPGDDTIWYGKEVGGFTELFTADSDGSNAVNVTNSGANNQMFISAFLFEQTSTTTDPPETPPTTGSTRGTGETTTETLAETGGDAAFAAALAVLSLVGLYAVYTYRKRYILS